MANIYKSEHTGAQVDDAVKKVLAAAPESRDELQKKLKEGTNITIADDGTISAIAPAPSVTITTTATDDGVVVLTGSGGKNSVSYEAEHAKKGPPSGYTSGNTTTSIGGSGASGIIKIPQITVDSYGHVTEAKDEDVTVTMPNISSYSVVELTTSQTTLTNEQYATLIASPFNKIKRGDYLYNLYEETNSVLVYTNNNLNNGKKLTINRTTLTITAGDLSSLTSHYTALNYIGVKDRGTNGATENGDTYLKLYENGTKRSQFNIKGTGATTVTSDTIGNITINSTDTDTKVTSADNHYDPLADSASEIKTPASSTTEATWGTTSLVTGVNIQRDAKGHVTGMTLDSIKMPAKPTTVTSLGGKTGAITLGSGLSISSNNVLSSTGGGSTFTFPAVDLRSAVVPGDGTFTDEQANLLYNNKVSFIIIKDNINGLDTFIVLPLVYLNASHNEYTYEATADGNTYTLTATLYKDASGVWSVKSYSITKTAAGGGSGSSANDEQKVYLGSQFNFGAMIGQTHSVSTNVDSSVAGLTGAEITGLIFDCFHSDQASSETASYSYQIRLNDLYRMFTADSMGNKSASLTLFDQRFSLTFSVPSTSYSQGTVNYNIPLTITPSLTGSTDALAINIGFTYKGFKFANGGTY